MKKGILPLDARYEYIAYATEKLKHAGFRLVYTSMKSEACYYAYGGKQEVLRVAAHRFSRTNDRDIIQPVVSCLTFHEYYWPKSQESVDSLIEFAVGRYFMAGSKGVFRWRNAMAQLSRPVTVANESENNC